MANEPVPPVLDRPCAECPWRLDVAPGRFPVQRFIDLAETAYDLALMQFACHKAPPGGEFACAGFLMNGAAHNLGVRLGRVATRDVSSPYPLHADYRAMAIANGAPPDHPALKPCRSP